MRKRSQCAKERDRTHLAKETAPAVLQHPMLHTPVGWFPRLLRRATTYNRLCPGGGRRGGEERRCAPLPWVGDGAARSRRAEPEMEPHAAVVRGGDGGCSAPDLRRCGRAASSEGGGRRGRRRSGQGRWRRPGKERAPPSPSPSPSPSTSSRAKPKILGLLPPLLPHPLLSLSLLRPVRSMPRWCESQLRLPPWISSSSEAPRRRSPAPPP
jgi:hypothetical protein